MAADRWRYNVVEVKPSSVWRGGVATEALQAELDRQGTQGWELVMTLPGTSGMGCLRLIFKRPA